MAGLGGSRESIPLVGGWWRTETRTWLSTVLGWFPYVAVAGAIPSRPLGWRSTSSTTTCLLDMGPATILRLLAVLNLWWLRFAILGIWTRTGGTPAPRYWCRIGRPLWGRGLGWRSI